MRVAIVSFLFFCFSFLVLIGCGYKPTTYYAKKELGVNAKYFVELDVDIDSAKNSVIIKDAVNEAIISKFGGKLVSKRNEADTIMNVSIGSISTSAIQYDTDPTSYTYGYANLYRTSVSITVEYSNKHTTGNFSASSSYEFAVDGSAVVSDTKKFQAIKNAASKAFDTVISSIAVRSFKPEHKGTFPDDSNTTQDVNASQLK